MKNKLTFYIAPAILLCWCLFSIQSCKDPVIKSKNLLTKSDTLNLAKDTLSIVATTILQNKLNSTGVIDGMLGSMNDNSFGVTYAGFYAQCALTTTSPTFGTHPILDSVVLSLAFDAPYGPCSKPMDIYVYELNQDLISNTSYYTTTAFQVKTPPIGKLTHYIPDFVDSVNVYQGGGNQAPQLRITLSKTFGYKLLNADSVNLLSDSLFLANVFKGIYVTASGSVGNGMMACNLSSALSNVTMYYRNAETGDSIENPFSFPISGITVNHFDNNYFGTPSYAAVQNPTANNQKLYLQGGGGLETKFTINLNSLPKNIGVNKAELVVAMSQPDSLYAAPSSLNLFFIDDAGVGQPIEDASTSTYGGYLRADTLNGIVVNRYHFNMSIYMQKLLQGIHNNNGLYLSVQNPISNPSRLVLTNPAIANTPNNNIYRTYLTVTYTKL